MRAVECEGPGHGTSVAMLVPSWWDKLVDRISRNLCKGGARYIVWPWWHARQNRHAQILYDLLWEMACSSKDQSPAKWRKYG